MPTTNRRPSWRVSAANEAGEGYKAGIGTNFPPIAVVAIEVERRGISIAVYPQLEFAPAHGAEKGLSEAGQTIVLPLLVAREFHAFTFVFNGELEKPLHDPSRELASGFGFAFGRSFTRKVAAMIELRTESSIDFQRDRLVLVNAGIIDGVRNVVVYANIGHSVFSDDGGHFYAGGGFKVVIGR